MKDKAESQGELPVLPRLGPTAAPPFMCDGFMLPPAATEAGGVNAENEATQHVVVDVDPNYALALPCTENFVSMGTVLTLVFGAMYLYFDQYGGSE